DIAEYVDALLGQELLGDRAGRHPAHRLASAGAAAAAVAAETELGVDGIAGMAGALLGLAIAVIVRALVGVARKDAHRCAVGLALEDAGPDLRVVFFLSLGDDLRLSRSAAAQVRQQVVFI